MFTPLLSVKKLIRSWFIPRKQETTHRKRASIQIWLESLEERLAPATISDGGTAALSIVLGTFESLAIVSNGTSYTFTSNQNFMAAGGTDPANQSTAFSGLGTPALTLTSPGLAQYSSRINISDTGIGDSVTFNGSGVNAYSNNFNVALTSAQAGPITFNGGSRFGAFNLQASTALNILVNSGAFLASSSGNLALQANQQALATTGTFPGVTINSATITSTGTGLITIQGRGGGDGIPAEGVLIENGASITGGTGSVAVSGTGVVTNNTQSATYGVYVSGANSTVTSTGGNVQVTGQGGTGLSNTNDYGVFIATGAQVSAGGNGSVSVTGTGGTGGQNEGVQVSGTIASSGGNVQVVGQGGGPGSSDYGVFVNGGTISAGGVGTVAVLGTGGSAPGISQNYGVYALGAISSSGGNVQVTGVGGSPTGLGNNNYGIYVTGAGLVTAGGNGNVSLQGTGGATSPGNDIGVNLAAALPGAGVTTSGGNVTLIGTGGGNSAAGSINNYGLSISGARVVAGGAGNITVMGTAGAQATGVIFANSSSVITTTGGSVYVTGAPGALGTLAIDVESKVTTPGAGSEVVFSGDSMSLNASVSAAGREVALLPLTTGTLISLGGADAAGTLGLTNAELGMIISGTLQIGNGTSGTITVSAPITLPAAINVNLISGSDIVLGAGTLNTDGGMLTLAPGSNGAVKPTTSGTDVNVTPAALAFVPGANLAIAINGTTPQSQYSQLSVLGGVNLTGANLVLSGNLTPVAGQTFTIVNNQETQPIVGTFNGLPEGAVIPNFLGSGLDATITYVGGDGNDVVLTVGSAVPSATSATASAASSVYGQAVTFTATVTANSGMPTGNVEFFDDTTGADLGAGTIVSSGAGTATWTYSTTPTQLKVTGSAHTIRAVYTPTGGFLGSSGTLAGGETITPAPLTVTGITVANKVYDGTTVATGNAGSATLVGVLAGDNVTLNTAGAIATFASRDVGNNVPVTVSGLTLAGAQAGDYTLSSSTGAPPAGVVAYWRFEEGSANTPATAANSILDSSGNGLNGSPVNGPVYQANVAVNPIPETGAANNLSLAFNGTSQRITIPDNPLFQLTHSLTLEAYVKLTAIQGSEEQIVFRGDDRPGLDPYMLEITGGNLQFRIEDGNGSQATVTYPFAPYVGQWVLVAGSLNDSTGKMSLYINGNLVASSTTTTRPLGPLTGANPGVGIGNVESSTYGEYFVGLIDEVLISSQALQPTQMLGAPTAVAATANITPAPLTVTGITANSKVYDSTRTATLNLANASLKGVLGGDTVTLNTTAGVGIFAAKDAGTNIPVAVSGLTIGGAQAGDYTLIQPTTAGNITAAPVTVTGITANSKTYDATTVATLNIGTPALAGVLSGDSVSVSAGVVAGVFASKDVGNNIPVLLTGLALGGPQAGDYVLGPLSANITPSILTVVGLTANSKTYDATVTATLNTAGATLQGVLPGDTVTLTGGAGKFASKDVGTGIPVTVTGLTLGGPQAADYTATFQGALAANITPAPLTVAGIAANKVYDGTAAATITTAGAALVGVFAGDAVTLIAGNPAGMFATKDVGQNITVTLTGVAMGGPQANDYTLTPTTTANITPAPLTVTGITVANKVYDTTTVATVNAGSGTLVGVLAGDNVTLNTAGATATFTSKDVGSNVPATVSGLTLLGAQAGDYTLGGSTGAPPAGVVAYWRFEEGSANTPATAANSILDSSGNGLNGTPINGPVYQANVAVNPIPETGAANNLSLAFNGTNQRITIPDNPAWFIAG